MKGRDPNRSKSGVTRSGTQIGQVEVTNGFGANTRQPYVEVNWPTDSGTIQLAPEDARMVARLIAEAAEAADQDAFLVAFLSEDIDLPWEEAVMVIPRFRAWREAQERKRRIASA